MLEQAVDRPWTRGGRGGRGGEEADETEEESVPSSGETTVLVIAAAPANTSMGAHPGLHEKSAAVAATGPVRDLSEMLLSMPRLGVAAGLAKATPVALATPTRTTCSIGSSNSTWTSHGYMVEG